MIKKLIAKKCETPQVPPCSLHGQAQDRGFSICPECAQQLTPIYQTDWPKTLAVYCAFLLLLLLCSVFGMGVVGEHLSLAQTAMWAMRQIHLRDQMQMDAQGKNMFSGYIISEGSGGDRKANGFICSKVNGQESCIWRYPSRDGDQIHFTITPKVPFGYVVYRSNAQSVLIQPRQQGSGKVVEGAELRIPETQNLRLKGGAGIEQFVLIFGDKQVPELDEQAKSGSLPTSSLDRVTDRLARDPGFAVLNVSVPHS